jgi:hypothetical protein
MNNFNVNNTYNCSIFLGVVLAVLLLSVSGWGSCSSTWNTVLSGSYCACDGPNYTPRPSSYSEYESLVSSLPSNCFAGPYICGASQTCTVTGYSKTCCSNQCETDSLKCIEAGGTWTNTGASTCDGKSCKLPVCKQADTQWLDSAKARCDALGGENNFAITEVGETCVHSGTCCTASDSVPVGNTCKWRCDSALTQCSGRAGSLFGAVLPDTSVSGEDTTFSYQCFYNCAYSPNPDSTVYLVEGNTVLSGPNDSIADGIKSEWFSSIRSTTGSIYVYDYLSPSASEYVDSIAAMKCVEHLWRCVINNKYVYWYDNQEVPAGCTNIVRVK